MKQADSNTEERSVNTQQPLVVRTGWFVFLLVVSDGHMLWLLETLRPCVSVYTWRAVPGRQEWPGAHQSHARPSPDQSQHQPASTLPPTLLLPSCVTSNPTHASQSGEDDTQDISTIISLPPASLPLPGLQAAPPHIVPPPPSSPPTATQPSSSYLQTFSTLNHLIW